MSENGFEVVGVSSAGKELDEVAESEGIRTVVLEMTRTIAPLRDLISLGQFYRLCKKEKPHIVHSHTPKAGIVGMFGAWLAGVPVRLHTVAGLPLMEASGVKRIVLDFVEKMTYAFATKVYPNSKGLYDFIVSEGYATADKLKVIANGSSNGIPTAFFAEDQVSEGQKAQLKQELGLQDNDFVFVFVGRLVGDKGINELVRAFKALLSSSQVTGEQPKLLLVGPQESELDPLEEDTLRDIEENPHILSVGFQKDVRSYFAVSDALVFPSYREGFPNVVMQAGAMGLPSIVSDINGCNEIIVEGQNGMIVPAKDATALAEAMQRLVTDRCYFENLQSHARQMITKQYEQQVVWDALLQEYQIR